MDGESKLFKLLLVGDKEVGKSCLLMRFVHDKFEETTPSVCLDLDTRTIEISDTILRVLFWDIPGTGAIATGI